MLLGIDILLVLSRCPEFNDGKRVKDGSPKASGATLGGPESALSATPTIALGMTDSPYSLK